MIKDKVENIISTYRRQRDDMATAHQQEHPNGDVWIKEHLCGKPYLKYVALMNIADVTNMTSQEMLHRIFIRGITNEFSEWKDAAYSGHMDKFVGKR